MGGTNLNEQLSCIMRCFLFKANLLSFSTVNIAGVV